MERRDIIADFIDHDQARDLPNVRYIELANGNKLNLKRADPFGFWYVSFEKGQVPAVLKSAFTTVEEAMKQIEIYLKAKNHEVKSSTIYG